MVLARLKTPCPWVRVALESDPCSAALRCAADAGTLVEARDEDEPVKALPLCTGQGRALLAALPDDSQLDRVNPAAMLFAAAYAQGAIPADVLSRNARRLYSYTLPSGDDREVAWCAQDQGNPEEAVCRLPLTATAFEYSRCRMRIDDEKHLVRVEELASKR